MRDKPIAVYAIISGWAHFSPDINIHLILLEIEMIISFLKSCMKITAKLKPDISLIAKTATSP